MNSNSSRTQTETSHNDEINQRQLLVSNSSRQLEEVSEMVSEESSIGSQQKWDKIIIKMGHNHLKMGQKHLKNGTKSLNNVFIPF